MNASSNYGAGGPELELSAAAYRYFRHKYSVTDDLDGSWLMHESFSITKLLNGITIGKKDKYALFTALFQSGKTFLAIDLVIIYLSLHMTPVIIVSKSADARQLISRMRKEMDIFISEMIKQGFSNEQLQLYDDILYDSSEQKISDHSYFHSALSQKRNRCIVCIKHHLHIERLLIDTEKSNIVLLIDEAHTTGGYKQISNDSDILHDEDIQYDCAIAQLKTKANKVILQSATCANIMISEKQLWSDCIYQKIPGRWYRGPTQIEYQIIGTKHSEMELVNALIQLSSEEPKKRIVYRSNGIKDIHPIYMLAHTTRSIDKMKRILRSFYNGDDFLPDKVINSNWLVMTFQGEGLRIWHKTFSENMMSIDGMCSISQGNGEHLFTSIEPEQMIAWCGSNGGVERFPRIVILSFDMGEEGITFGTHLAPYWHLTHLLMFGNTTSSRTAQILNRLSGNHGDNHALIAMVSNANKQKSIKEFIAHDEWVRELSTLKQKGNFQISNYLIEKEHLEGRIPNKFISIKGGKNILKKGFNPQLKKEKEAMKHSHASEICIVFDSEKFKLDYEKMIEEKKLERKRVSVLDTNENKIAVTNAYEKTKSKVRMIINTFINKHFSPLSVDEIRMSNLSLRKINITNYDRWEGGRSAKYKILEKTINDKYIIRSEIITLLQLF
jgi:hypothetical protein